MRIAKLPLPQRSTQPVTSGASASAQQAPFVASTGDLTLFDMATEREADAGGTFDYFGELSHPDYRNITDEQYAVRMTLREIMLDAGFKPLDEEWWHFTLVDEPYPDTYFTFPVNAASVGK